MTFRRLLAIGFIFGCITLAWFILGTSVTERTSSGYDRLGEQVEELWGSPHIQKAPEVYLLASDKENISIDVMRAELESSEIDVEISLEHRRKGLLWYATYDIVFDGNYAFHNSLDEAATATVKFDFPSSRTIYDDFEYRVNEVEVTPRGEVGNGLEAVVELEPGESAEIHIAYKSRGLDSWAYSFADEIITVKNFILTVNTDFNEYNFPWGTISASTKTKTNNGWDLQWEFEKMVSDFDVGVEMPNILNPGPLVSRMSYFAPISLLFFFAVLVVLGAVSKNNLHPIHYFFLGASFFSFHILFAYLVDHLIPEISFIIAAIISMLLVVSYLWRVMGKQFAIREAGISQFLFLVLFSYAFFFEGYTGLVITIGAVITLAALMQITAKVDWVEIFRNPKSADSK